VRGDLRAHGARAQNSSFFDLNHGGKIILNERSFSKESRQVDLRNTQGAPKSANRSAP
jgi:hypothetical protein